MKARFKELFKSRLFQTALIAILFLAVGIFLGINSWNKIVYVQVKPGGKGRYVASTGKTELMSLSLEEYREQIQKKVLGNAKEGKLTDGIKKFYLGNFIVQEKEGHQRICQAYSFIEMRFISNVSLSGSRGEMVIQAPCQEAAESTEEEKANSETEVASGQEVAEGIEAEKVNGENEESRESLIGPFLVPIDEILNNPAKEFFSIEEKEVSIRFYDAAIMLTDSWLLTAVRFFNSPENEGFIVRFIPGEETDAFELFFQ
ncbi:MAG: hypothetical protein OXB86_04975 [Bdellovibrionales bacterium]|nr:hypothetical protein [Bdellovibrionales bacterium]